MAKLALTLNIVGEEGSYDSNDVTCDSYNVDLVQEGRMYHITFVNGLDENGSVIREVLVDVTRYVSIGVVELPEETVTITASEYEALKEAQGHLDGMVALAEGAPLVLISIREYEAMQEALHILTDLNGARHAEERAAGAEVPAKDAEPVYADRPLYGAPVLLTPDEASRTIPPAEAVRISLDDVDEQGEWHIPVSGIANH